MVLYPQSHRSQKPKLLRKLLKNLLVMILKKFHGKVNSKLFRSYRKHYSFQNFHKYKHDHWDLFISHGCSWQKSSNMANYKDDYTKKKSHCIVLSFLVPYSFSLMWKVNNIDINQLKLTYNELQWYLFIDCSRASDDS